MTATTMTIVAPVPGALGRALERLRQRLDPDATNTLAAHVPLVAPFAAEPSFLPLEQHCWRVCHERAPFRIELGALAVDETARQASVAIASGADEVVALRQALVAGKYAPPRSALPDREPAVEVGPVTERDDVAIDQWETAAERAGPAFRLERIELLARYPDGTWYMRDFYTLDRAVAKT